jgi:hypothetical protein
MEQQQAARPGKKKAAAPYHIGGGSGYGYTAYTVGQVVKTCRTIKGREDWPEYLIVVRRDQRYIEADGFSFGVGDECGYIYSADCRAATDAEAAQLKGEIEDIERKRQAWADLQAIKAEMRKDGERPAAWQDPVGARYFDTQNNYGGGDWFVVGPDWVWYVRNNGADGDAWGDNNVQTGGAGAIGWRVAYSAHLLARLDAVLDIVGDAIEKDARDRQLAAMAADDRAGRTPDF